MWITVLYLQFIALSGRLIQQIYRDTFFFSFFHWKCPVKAINFHEVTLKLGPEVLWPEQTVDKAPLAMKQIKNEDYSEDASVTELFGYSSAIGVGIARSFPIQLCCIQ